ncbi:hypothetical protein Bbelb_105440 [Branchiostoma belcheri]|nr:hypothetical protein Bbelb_105440 [Branchiostoma belcheri]
MWSRTLWLLPLFLTWAAAHALADVGDLQTAGGPDGVGLPRSQGIPLHVLVDGGSYVDDAGSPGVETTADVVKRAPGKLSRFDIGEGYSRYGRGYLQQLMSSLESGYNRSNRKGLTRHNLDLGYSRYGRSADQQPSRQQLSRDTRATKPLNRFDLGLGYSRYGRGPSKALNRFDLGLGYSRYGRAPKPLNRFNLGLGYNRYGRGPKALNRFDLGLGYNRYGRGDEAATASPDQAAASDGSTGGDWQAQRWQDQPGYDEPSPAGEDNASTGLTPYDKDDDALPARPISPRHIRDVMTPFRSWLPAHARSLDEASES